MSIYTYKARDKKGALIRGEIEANSASDLKEALFKDGLIPLDVSEVKKGGITLDSIMNIFNRVKAEELMIFTRQFYTLFKAGVSVDTILSTLSRQTASHVLKNALERIRTDIASGSTLSQAFGRHPKIFNELYVSMLAAGEEAGILDQSLMHLSVLLEREFEINKGIKNATLYPKIVLTVLVSAIIFLMTFVVPKFASFYGHYHATLPLPTRILITSSNVVRGYWYLVAIAVILIYVLYLRYYRTRRGKLNIDRLKFRLPVFGKLNLKVANARFSHILSALYKSGLGMPRSLEVVSDVIGNAAFALDVLMVRDAIRKGSTLSEAMSSSQYFPAVVVETAAVGEKAGALDEMLSTIGQHYELEVNHTIKNLTTLLEPLLLVGIFAVVALLALAIFLPIWSLSGVVGK